MKTSSKFGPLQQKRLLEVCWWLKPSVPKLHNSSVAQAWETLRRTKVFSRFCEKAMAMHRSAVAAREAEDPFFAARELEAIRNVIFAKKPTQMSFDDWLPMGSHDPIANWSNLFLAGCRPQVTWVELGEAGRQAIYSNSPILPRQELVEAASFMYIAVCRLERDKTNTNSEQITGLAWTANLQMKPLPASGIRVLPNGVASETYVVVTFELGLPAEALERQFDIELKARLFPGDRDGELCKLINCDDAVYKWKSDVPPGQVIYPPLWLDAQRRDVLPRTHEKVVTIPGRQSPFAMCWIPARNDFDLVRSRFHNAVREEHRPALEKKCATYWALPEVAPGIGGRTQKVPAWDAYVGIKAGLKRKPATNAEFWIGLAAFEFRQAGINFHRSAISRNALKYFPAQSDPDLIRPALAAVRKRIREIDALYESII